MNGLLLYFPYSYYSRSILFTIDVGVQVIVACSFSSDFNRVNVHRGGRMEPVSPTICLFSNCIQHIHMQRAPTYAVFVDQILQRALRHDSRFYVSWLEGCQNNCLGQTRPNFLFHVAAVGVIVPYSLALKFRNGILPTSSG